MGKITAAITGVGLYLPDYILTNEELSTMVDTSDEWIMSHIGVKTRHILKGEGVGTSYMGARGQGGRRPDGGGSGDLRHGDPRYVLPFDG